MVDVVEVAPKGVALVQDPAGEGQDGISYREAQGYGRNADKDGAFRALRALDRQGRQHQTEEQGPRVPKETGGRRPVEGKKPSGPSRDRQQRPGHPELSAVISYHGQACPGEDAPPCRYSILAVNKVDGV